MNPRTPEQIAVGYNVPVEAVKEPIAYCESDPPELLKDYRREEALMEASGMNDPTYKYHRSQTLLAAHYQSCIMRLSVEADSAKATELLAEYVRCCAIVMASGIIAPSRP